MTSVQRAFLVSSIALASAVIAGCTTQIPGHGTIPRSATSSPGKPGSSQEREVHLGDLKNSKTPMQYGLDSGAPFNPCDPGIWNSVTPDLRPDQAKLAPTLLPESVPDGPICKYANDTVAVQSSGSGFQNTTFDIYVSWASRLTDLTGATSTQYAGKPGLQKPGTLNGQPSCNTRVFLANGQGGVIVANTRFPGVDPCAAVRSVSEYIAREAR